MKRRPLIGIDASNLREGGGRTHLVELLNELGENLDLVKGLVVWGSRETLQLVPSHDKILRVHEPWLDGPLPSRMLWQRLRLPLLARRTDLLFAPGGITTSLVRPRVVMCRNMLPFEDIRHEYRGWLRVKFALLRLAQSISFSEADGVIFLSEYARASVAREIRLRRATTIAHGVGEQFAAIRGARALQRCSHFLYVSTVSEYKHQLEVVQAVAALRRDHDVTLTLAGPGDGTGYKQKVLDLMSRHDPGGTFLTYVGRVPYVRIHELYQRADAFVFASECENLPNSLLEAMASELPIACAKCGPMPEVLGHGGIYFDPRRTSTIEAALRTLVTDATLRQHISRESHRRSREFTWRNCARATFQFLAEVHDSEIR